MTNTTELMWVAFEKCNNWPDQMFALQGLADAAEECGDELLPTLRWMIQHDHLPLVTDWWNRDRDTSYADGYVPDKSDLPEHIFIHLEIPNDVLEYRGDKLPRRIRYETVRKAIMALHNTLKKAGVI